jgi:hypothetical protein
MEQERMIGGHKMNSRKLFQTFFAGSLVCIALALGAMAQDTSQTTTSTGQATKETQVRSGEVVYVSGNDLVVKTDDGKVKHFTVPEGATATVDGQQMSIHDLKPGMKLQQTITTTTTPEIVKTVRTIKGKVWQVQPPVSVILKLPDGTNQQYKIPKGQKFDVNGQQTDAWGLKKGMEVTATVIKETPEDVVAQTRTTTGEMPTPPPPPATPPQEGVLLVEVEEAPAPAQVAQAEKPATLPQTASFLPLIGLVGALALGLGLKIARDER